jgi:hypothetical protein
MSRAVDKARQQVTEAAEAGGQGVLRGAISLPLGAVAALVLAGELAQSSRPYTKQTSLGRPGINEGQR